MFYIFGALGFIWSILWLLFYVDINPAALLEYEEEFEDANKVCYVCIYATWLLIIIWLPPLQQLK